MSLNASHNLKYAIDEGLKVRLLITADTGLAFEEAAGVLSSNGVLAMQSRESAHRILKNSEHPEYGFRVLGRVLFIEKMKNAEEPERFSDLWLLGRQKAVVPATGSLFEGAASELLQYLLSTILLKGENALVDEAFSEAAGAGGEFVLNENRDHRKFHLMKREGQPQRAPCSEALKSFLYYTIRFSDSQIERYRRENAAEKLHEWEVYRRFQRHTLEELETGRFDALLNTPVDSQSTSE